MEMLADLKDLKGRTTTEIVRDENSFFKKFEFPLKTEDNLIAFNSYLAEADNFSQAVSRILFLYKSTYFGHYILLLYI